MQHTPHDLDRVYTLEDLPAAIPPGYTLHSCNPQGGMRLVRRTPEDERRGDAQFAQGKAGALAMQIAHLEDHLAAIPKTPENAAVVEFYEWRIEEAKREQDELFAVAPPTARAYAERCAAGTRNDILRWRQSHARPLQALRATRPRPRERRPGRTRRTSSSSTSSGQDPSDPDLDGESSGGELRPIGDPLAAELDRIAERLRARGGGG